MSHLEGVLHTIRAQVLLLIITPYKSIRLDSLAAQLGGGVPVDKVEDLIVELILDGRISGKLDQIHGKLELTGQKSSLDVGNARDDALIKWTKTMDQLLTKVMNKFA
jgi:COP9 signalosome complex subunit 2